jgi:hypothetical protein
MAVLSNVDSILIRATYNDNAGYIAISDVELDTAAPYQTHSGIASEIENCYCPPGYSGTSCEVGKPIFGGKIDDRSIVTYFIFRNATKCTTATARNVSRVTATTVASPANWDQIDVLSASVRLVGWAHNASTQVSSASHSYGWLSEQFA